MVSVTGNAARKPDLLEPVFHPRFFEQFRDLCVTDSACVSHEADLGRHGAVVAMAVVARRRAEVAFVHHGFAVHAFPPFCIFVAGKRLVLEGSAFHALRIRMARGTRLGHARDVDRRFQVGYEPNSMFYFVLGRAVRFIVAGNTSGDFRIAVGLESLAVAARPVLGQLIGAGEGV